MHFAPSRGRSIRSKLSRLVFLSVGVALLFSAVLDVWQEARRYLVDKQDYLLATANVVATAASNAVAERRTPLILDSLRSISRVPGLAYARVESVEGDVLAELGGAVRLSTDPSLAKESPQSVWSLLRSRTVQVDVPIVRGGRSVGRLSLVAETPDLFARFMNVLLVEASGALFAIGAGLVIAFQLQRSITGPLNGLTAKMTSIAETQDYTASVPVASQDEIGQLAGSFNTMLDEIRKAVASISSREAEIIFRLSRATEQRDNETGAHILRMASLCRLAAEGLNLDAATADALYRAAPLHDVGKIAVPDAIMFKAGKLDAAERGEMEKHTSFGYEILRDSESDLIRLAAEMAWSHHERWDGTGYPRGLGGDDIPFPGRIAAVADVCDALASERPYKPAWSLEAVRAHLVDHSGSQFDATCVQGLLDRWAEVERLYAGSDGSKLSPQLEAA